MLSGHSVLSTGGQSLLTSQDSTHTEFKTSETSFFVVVDCVKLYYSPV